MISIPQAINNDQEVDIVLVGITNPFVIVGTPATYWLLIMDKSTDEDDKYKNDCALYYLSGTTSFGSHPAPYLSLFRIQTSEGANERALGGSDDYNLHFGIVFDESATALSVETKENQQGKFFVYFPPQYMNFPTQDLVTGGSAGEITCSLFTISAASGDMEADLTATVKDSACTWNNTIDPRGNALQFDAGDQTYVNLNAGGTGVEYVLQLKAVGNPFNGVKRTRDAAAIDVAYPDPTPYNYLDAIKWKTY